MNHPALPSNPSLSKLLVLLDQAQRWLDHCDNWEDHAEIEDFISELEVKVNEFTDYTDHLKRCFKANQT